MAKVKITGHASGSGVITVTAPNTSTDRTITLPDSTATLATTTEVALKAPLASPEFTGNVGIGATPHDTHAAFDTIEFDRGSIISQSTATSGHFITGSNMYYSSGGGPAYQITAAATTITQLGGEILLQTAPSGTADAGVTLTTKATIDTDGLKFNGDTAAANALDDYEEGTWTPSGTNVRGTSVGRYTKIGNMCWLQGWIHVEAAGSTNNYIEGLPFTSAATGNANGGGTPIWLQDNITGLYVVGSATKFNLYGGSSRTAFTPLSASNQMHFVLQYITT